MSSAPVTGDTQALLHGVEKGELRGEPEPQPCQVYLSSCISQSTKEGQSVPGTETGTGPSVHWQSWQWADVLPCTTTLQVFLSTGSLLKVMATLNWCPVHPSFLCVSCWCCLLQVVIMMFFQ